LKEIEEMKNMEDLFKMALGIEDPWYVDSVDFEEVKKILTIKLDFKKGSKFFYEDKAAGISGTFPVHDTIVKRWRHLNFFQHECYLEARVPRIITGEGNVRLTEVPWAGKLNGFTLLFEALILQFARCMPPNQLKKIIGVSNHKIWKIIEEYVDEMRELQDMSEVKEVGIDETSARKRHDYITLFVDLEKRSVVHIEEGKGTETVKGFADRLEEKNCEKSQIKRVCSDMSPAFISGVKENFPEASITFDRFHVMKIINEAVDNVRKWEKSNNPQLKNMRYLLLQNRKDLSASDLRKIEELEMSSMHLNTVKAYHMREAFQMCYQAESAEVFELIIKKWCDWVKESEIFNMVKVAKTIERHLNGIVMWYQTRITNGILEGFNSLIQAAKAKARGYSTKKNLINIAYLLLGKLDLSRINRFYQPTHF
jgi:transposase